MSGAMMKLTQEKRFPVFPGNNVGLSWFIKEIDGKQTCWHNGGTTGFKMCNSFCNNPAVAIVVLCNTGSDASDDGRDFYRVGDTLIRKLIETGMKSK